VHKELAPYYPHTGRPSIDPVPMMLIVGYVFAIRSERRICAEVQVNLAYRWFCKLGIEDKVPHLVEVRAIQHMVPFRRHYPNFVAIPNLAHSSLETRGTLVDDPTFPPDSAPSRWGFSYAIVPARIAWDGGAVVSRSSSKVPALARYRVLKFGAQDESRHFSPLGPRRIWTPDQRSDQAQEFLLLRSVASRNEKGSDLNVDDLASGGKIGLMPDEHPTSIRIAREQPPVPVGAAVNLSGPNGHAKFPSIATYREPRARDNRALALAAR
jgi:hypothetical protein